MKRGNATATRAYIIMTDARYCCRTLFALQPRPVTVMKYYTAAAVQLIIAPFHYGASAYRVHYPRT